MSGPAAPSLLPEGFRFGVATAGFQVEGGFNGPGEPRNNWYGWEAAGRVEPSGAAVNFWANPERLVDLAAGLGCDSFRLSVEWARVVPDEGEVDHAALDRYRRILAACRDRGLRPLVTLHHFTHPWWLGEEFWLRPDAPECFLDWVRVALDALGEGCTEWITLNEPNCLALESWFLGRLPPGRRGGLAETVLALDHLLAAHVLAYDEIHRLQPDAVVATNPLALSLYDLDQLCTDLLVARHHGVAPSGLAAWTDERRQAHDAAVALPAGPAAGVLERGLRRLARRAVAGRPAGGDGRTLFARATAAVYDSPHDRLTDVAAFDFYAPGAAGALRPPGLRTAGGRSFDLGRPLWDDPPDPAGLEGALCRAAHSGLEVWVAENGLCNRVRRGRSYPRRDGWTRPRYLRENLGALVGAVDLGAPVTGYWHWSLVDNYEWGSYQPRFGLYGVDRARGLAIDAEDAMGDDAAGAYRDLIAALRAGDRSVLSEGGAPARLRSWPSGRRAAPGGAMDGPGDEEGT